MKNGGWRRGHTFIDGISKILSRGEPYGSFTVHCSKIKLPIQEPDYIKMLA